MASGYLLVCSLTPYLSTLPISSGDSQFRGFLPITRSQQKISRYHDLDQDFLSLKMIQFFEKLFNFVCQYLFFLKGKEYSSTSASTDLIFTQDTGGMKQIPCTSRLT